MNARIDGSLNLGEFSIRLNSNIINILMYKGDVIAMLKLSRWMIVFCLMLVFSLAGLDIGTAQNDERPRISLETVDQVTVVQVLTEGNATFNHDGSLLATVEEGNIHLWDTTTFELSQTIMDDSTRLFGLRFSPDGSRIAAYNLDGDVKLWDSATGQDVITVGTYGRGIYFSFSSDSAFLAISGEDGIHIWNVETQSEQVTLEQSEPGPVGFSPDGAMVVHTSGYRSRYTTDDDSIELLDVASGSEVLKYAGREFLDFSPDNSTIVVQVGEGESSELHFVDVASGEKLFALAGTTGLYTPDGTHYFYGSGNSVNSWDTQTETDETLLDGVCSGSELDHIILNDDGSLLILGCSDGTTSLHEASGEYAKKRELVTGSLSKLSPDERFLLGWAGDAVLLSGVGETEFALAPGHWQSIATDESPSSFTIRLSFDVTEDGQMTQIEFVFYFTAGISGQKDQYCTVNIDSMEPPDDFTVQFGSVEGRFVNSTTLIGTIPDEVECGGYTFTLFSSGFTLYWDAVWVSE